MSFRASRPLLIHPLVLGGIFLAKKAIILGGAQAYGIPRLYRRILETQRRLLPNRSAEEQKQFKTIVKSAIRLPNEAIRLFDHYPELLENITKILQENTKRKK